LTSAEDRETCVGAVISAFNPGQQLLANVELLLGQLSWVVVVDDGSPLPPEDLYRELEARGAIVERLARNSGIAAALNRGVARLRPLLPAEGSIATFDQDSRVERGFVAALLRAARTGAEDGLRVGMVAPAVVTGLPHRGAKRVGRSTLSDEPVQSGLLIPLAVLDQIGGFREDLFIDGVDSEFYLRALDAGLSPLLAEDAKLSHSLGTLVPARLLGVPIRLGDAPLRVRTAAPWRYYYICRNRLLLIRSYGRRHPRWALRGILTDLRHLAIVSVLAPGRAGRLRNALAGVRDGIRGRSGPRMPA
jgi:rhamnosyltransferase